MNGLPTFVVVKPETRHTETLMMGDVDFTNVRSATFGELVKLAMTKVEHYHSDLYHDAQWIEEHMTADLKSFEFFYIVRNMGTHIGQDEHLLKQVTGTGDEVGYHVTIYKSGYRIVFESVEIDA